MAWSSVPKEGTRHASSERGNRSLRRPRPRRWSVATTGLSTPAGLAFDKDGNLYVSNRGDGTIRKFSRSGADLGYFATTGMITPVGLAFGPEAEDQDENGDG